MHTRNDCHRLSILGGAGITCAHQRLHARWIVYALAAVTCELLAMAAAQTTEQMLHTYSGVHISPRSAASPMAHRGPSAADAPAGAAMMPR